MSQDQNNRELAEQALDSYGHRGQDEVTDALILARAGVHALLDIADAIRESTARTTHPAGKATASAESSTDALQQIPGLAEWSRLEHRGLAAEAIATHLSGVEIGSGSEGYYPCSAADLGRCLQLLEMVPSFRPRIAEMARVNEPWAKIAARWFTLKGLYLHETMAKGDTPKTTELLQQLIKESKQ